MLSKFNPLKKISRENIHRKFHFRFQTQRTKCFLHNPISQKLFPCFTKEPQHFHSFKSCVKLSQLYISSITERTRLLHSASGSDKPTDFQQAPDHHQSAIFVQNVLKYRREKSFEEIEQALNRCGLILTEDFVLDVIRRHRSDWKPAYIFFNWVSRKGKEDGFSLGTVVYNEILDILGTMRRFDELTQVLDEMSKRNGLINEETYGILLNRYAAAHKVEEAIDIFYKRRGYGLEISLAAFQTLLMWLCRYKHVEAAETLFHLKKHEFREDIKTRNIILNGWCVLGSVREAKRFWNDIIQSKCKPDIFTYGTFINSLTKKGKLGTALKLFKAMWDDNNKDCNRDVVICNNIIDALCFKKRIPEALEIFKEMNERGCNPNVGTYNSLIKHLCKIRRIKKVYELLDEMEEKESCMPNAITFNYLLKSLKEPDEVPKVLQRMKRNGCTMTSDTYNLVLRLCMEWDDQERVKYIWDDMMKNGLGPDRRSYTIMIHGFYDKGRIDEALSCFRELTVKGIEPEPRTDVLVNAINVKLQDTKTRRNSKE